MAEPTGELPKVKQPNSAEADAAKQRSLEESQRRSQEADALKQSGQREKDHLIAMNERDRKLAQAREEEVKKALLNSTPELKK